MRIVINASKFLTRMGVFLAAVAGVGAVLYEALAGAFLANAALNGVIAAVLLIGIVYAFRRILDLGPEEEWIVAFRRQQVPSGTPPRLMASAAKLLAGDDEGGAMRLSATSMRSVLDGIASRLEESREVSRYLTGLLIFLGLLGTFWGLLDVLPAIGDTIRGLTVDGSDMALMFDELKAGLEAPLGGMATAFSSSLFGLAGSLILGFLDLQASQAQTRFYNEVEDWLASVTKLGRAADEGAMTSPGAYMTALMEQTADGIDKLSRTLQRSEDDRQALSDTMTTMAQSLAALTDRLAVDDAEQARGVEANRMLAQALEKLATRDGPQDTGLDPQTREHIRNMDVGLKRLADVQAKANDRLVDDLRTELKLLSRTIAATLDGSRTTSEPPPLVARRDAPDETGTGEAS